MKNKIILNPSLKVALSLLMLSLSACSMKDPNKGTYGVSVQLPKSFSQVDQKKHQSFGIKEIKPSSLGQFKCFALNVTGPGISANPAFPCTDPVTAPAMITPFQKIADGAILAVDGIPAGPSRTIQLIAMEMPTSGSCPDLVALIAANGANSVINSSGLYAQEPYIIASNTQDIFSDISVSMTAAFDPAAQAFNSCGNHDNGNNNSTPSISLNFPGNDPEIQAAGCMPVEVNAQNVSALLPISFTVGAAGGTFYADSYCSTAVSGPLTLSNSNMMQLSLKAAGAVGTTVTTSLTVSPATIQASPSVAFTVVQKHLMMNMAGVYSPWTSPTTNISGSCIELDFQTSDPLISGGSLTPLEAAVTYQFAISGHNDASPNAKIYSTAALCATAAADALASTALPVGTNIAPSSSGNGQLTFQLTSANVTNISGHSSVFLLDTTGEELDFGFTIPKTLSSLPTNSAQSAGTYLSYLPFSLGYVSGGSLNGSDSGGGTISFPFYNSTGTLVTAITIGSTDCPFSGTPSASNITCTVPALTALIGPPGSYDIYLTVGGISYYSGYSYNYTGVPPTLLVTANQNLTFIQNEPLSAVAALATGTTSCNISGTYPAGMLFDSSTCSFTGSPTTLGTTSSLSLQAYNSAGNVSVLFNILVVASAVVPTVNFVAWLSMPIVEACHWQQVGPVVPLAVLYLPEFHLMQPLVRLLVRLLVASPLCRSL